MNDRLDDVMDLTAEDELLGDITPLSAYSATEIDPVETDRDNYEMEMDGREESVISDHGEPGPRATLEVSYSQPPAQLLEQWNVPLDHVCVLDLPAVIDDAPPEHPLELFAYRVLRRGSVTLESLQDMLQAILQHLPQLTKARKRKCTDFSVTKEGKSFSLTWGSYVIGGSAGVTRNTLVAMIRGQKKEHVFSSISLRLNTYMAPHLDKHSHPAIPSLLVACGRLWTMARGRTLGQQECHTKAEQW